MTPDGNDGLNAAHSRPAGYRPPSQRRGRGKGLVILAVAVVVLGVAVYMGIRDRATAEEALAKTTEESATPSVNTVHPTPGAPNETVVLPGSTQAFTDTPIYARTNGYLKKWYFDIGAKVKRGDLLAEIDTPEIDEQLRVARADLEIAQAHLKLAEITATRNEDLLKTRSVATQDRDNAVGAFMAAKATTASQEANVARLERLQSYEKVFAPFDGVITARNTDIGALIDAGANSVSRELFHLSSTDKLRVFVQLPEVYSRDAHTGDPATLTLDEYPGQTFKGTLVRTANAIDATTRTLLVEVDVNNGDDQLLPGSYAFVHLSLSRTVQSVTVPSNTLIFRKEGLRLAVIRDGHAKLVPVTIGRDYGDRVEIVSGLSTSETVILNPSDSLLDGATVAMATPQQQAQAQQAGPAK
ncbi:MAG TPA: efflux RND transporter periplasmic adaptor subunit [Magnetospirillaceae bacterium]